MWMNFSWPWAGSWPSVAVSTVIASVSFRTSERTRVYLRHELMSGLDSMYGLNASSANTQRTVFGLASNFMANGNVFSEYRMNDAMSGREAFAAIGLRNLWTVSNGVRLSTGLERLTPLQSKTTWAATAASLGAEYTGLESFKGTGRLEWRGEGATHSWLSTVGAAQRLSRDWTMLARNYFQRTSDASSTTPLTAFTPTAPGQRQDWFSVGAAYRDATTNRLNLLSRYELKFERLPGGSNVLAPLTDRHVQIASTHADYHPSGGWLLSGQYAGKWVSEQIDGQPSDYAAHLVSSRAGYDLTPRLDLGGLFSAMWSGSDDKVRRAVGAELGILLRENTWASIGYNFTGFSDRDFNAVVSSDATTRGFFLRLRMKFDENLLGLGNRQGGR